MEELFKEKIKYAIMLQIITLLIFTLIGDINTGYRYYKYIVMIINIIFFLILIISMYDRTERVKKISEMMNYYLLAAFLIGISLFLQIYNLDSINIRTFDEIFFIMNPLLFVSAILMLDGGNLKWYINKIAYIYLGMFIIRYADIITIKNIQSINFFKSYSPFESDYAQIFALFAVYFLINKKYGRYCIYLFLTILSMKRATVLILLLYPFAFIPLSRIKKLNRNIVMIIFVVFNLAFLGLMYSIINDDFNEFFYNYFGKSLDAFTMGRTDIFKFLLQGNFNLMNGFGYTTYFLRDIISYPGFTVIHGEHVKIFLETGLVGIIGFFALFFRNVRNGKLLMLAILINSMFCFTHILDMSLILLVYFLITGSVLRESKENNAIDSGGI